MKARTRNRRKPKLTREDQYDLATFKARRKEPRIPFEVVLNRLRKDGLI